MKDTDMPQSEHDRLFKLRKTLVSALTEYDRKQSKRKHYNPNALALYFAALDEAWEYYETNGDIVKALEMYFCGRVLDVVLKAVKS